MIVVLRRPLRRFSYPLYIPVCLQDATFDLTHCWGIFQPSICSRDFRGLPEAFKNMWRLIFKYYNVHMFKDACN